MCTRRAAERAVASFNSVASVVDGNVDCLRLSCVLLTFDSEKESCMYIAKDISAERIELIESAQETRIYSLKRARREYKIINQILLV